MQGSVRECLTFAHTFNARLMAVRQAQKQHSFMFVCVFIGNDGVCMPSNSPTLTNFLFIFRLFRARHLIETIYSSLLAWHFNSFLFSCIGWYSATRKFVCLLEWPLRKISGVKIRKTVSTCQHFRIEWVEIFNGRATSEEDINIVTERLITK